MPQWTPRSLRPTFEAAPPRLKKLLLDPVAFFQVFCEYEGHPIRLDSWQVAFLHRRARYRAMAKSVQIGFSWICAMEALHLAFFYEDETSSFVSINEEDAKEKILYAQKLYDGIEPQIRRLVPIARESTDAFWLGDRHRPSRLLSLPASSGLRGRATHIYLDEIDHYRPGLDAQVFTAAMGRVTRAKRRLTVGSSVFGEDTMLAHLLARDEYRDFLKFEIPWWACETPEVREGIEFQRRNMPAEDFAQEYECRRADAADSAFPQNLIRASWHPELAVDVDRLDADATFVAGYDPGGSRHPAVLTVLESVGRGWKQVSQVAIRGEPLAAQRDRLDQMLGLLPRCSLAIDQGGAGLQMTQELRTKWGNRVRPVVFNRSSRSEMTLGLRGLLESGGLSILHDRELAYQLNRTKRMPGGEVVQSGTDSRSHFDKYWALALAASLITAARSVYERRGLRFFDIEGES